MMRAKWLVPIAFTLRSGVFSIARAEPSEADLTRMRSEKSGVNTAFVSS